MTFCFPLCLWCRKGGCASPKSHFGQTRFKDTQNLHRLRITSFKSFHSLCTAKAGHGPWIVTSSRIHFSYHLLEFNQVFWICCQYKPFSYHQYLEWSIKKYRKIRKKIYGLNFRKGHISKDTGLKIIIFAINKSKLDAFMANEVNFEIL